MRKIFVVLFGLLSMGVFANQALAAATDPRTGFIEVCKAANPALTGTFQFNIHDSVGDRTVTIGLGTCTQPIPAVPGSVTVTELGSLTGLTNSGTISSTPTTEFLSATTTAVGPTGPLTPGTGFVYTTTVTASPGGSQNVVTVTYNDQLVTGVVEVCKAIVTGSGLTGSWSFTITGGNGFSQVITVPTGNCSQPITVPAGKVKVQETGDLSEAVTAITATQTASNVDAVIGPNASAPKYDLPTATVVASVAVGDASKQTLVTFTNTSVRLKLCKYVDGGLTNTTAPGNSQFPFTFTATGNAGPNGPIAPLSLAAGNSKPAAVCTVVGTFRAGTTVTITEGIVAGTKVASIDVNPDTDSYDNSSTVVPGSLSLANRTVAVVLGAGETVVTYEDVKAATGILKICKTAGVSIPPVVPGTLFSFTVTPTSPAGAPSTVSVPTGSCTIAGTFAFDTTLSVVETAVPNTTVQSITAIPTSVVVIVGGVVTNTSQLVLTNVNLPARSASVTIGENNTTELTFVNIDPPPTSGGGSGGSGGSSGGSGGSSGGSGGSSGGSGGSSGGSGGSSGGSGGSSSTAATSSLVVSPAPSLVSTGPGVAVVLGTTSSVGKTSATTKAALTRAVKLAMDKKKLAALKVTLKKLVAKHAAAKTHARKLALAKQITAVKVSEAKLIKQINLLK